jgi:hypothetical protein
MTDKLIATRGDDKLVERAGRHFVINEAGETEVTNLDSLFARGYWEEAKGQKMKKAAVDGKKPSGQTASHGTRATSRSPRRVVRRRAVKD